MLLRVSTPPFCAVLYQPSRTNLRGSGSCTTLKNGWKSCRLWYPSNVKTNNKPSGHFFSLPTLYSTQIKRLGDISQWCVDDMTVYLWFFSVFKSTLDLFGKKIMGWIKVQRLADKHLDDLTGWPKRSHLALEYNNMWTLLHAIHTPTYFGDLYFFFFEAMMLIAISQHFLPQTAFTSLLHHL